MTWTPPKYKLGDGLPERRGRAKCPCCGLWVWPFRLTRVRGHLSFTLHKGVEYACDGCLEKWFRQGRPMGGNRIFTEEELGRAYGAPADVWRSLEGVTASRLRRSPALANKYAAAETARGENSRPTTGE